MAPSGCENPVSPYQPQPAPEFKEKAADREELKGESAGFCCQVPANPAFHLLERKGFKRGYRAALRSETGLSIVVVGNY
ncbi:hypothetical protein GCM10010862_18170 [Devosia nitrariae]|uniref:Uncharacterized protein n=1 Tax=Devosia nitrariae TaxID=2071872 RepID=A0ABQ5W3X9_9HYPH|nr:hypothetical protein GCM10010862_18170 [Devosia nitrariae]